uniref:Uncharacterized protein n=1 Tax=Ascaris lumbricoides TaxID=6252 RepID=A0A0M3IMQ3_ASCLU
MYLEIYAELEKVRNMLLIQHTINQQHLNEIKLLNENCDYYKSEYERKLAELTDELNRRTHTVHLLENQIKSIAYDGQQQIHKTLSVSIALLFYINCAYWHLQVCTVAQTIDAYIHV